MDNNAEYYDRNARQFFETTVNVEMSPLHERFLARIPAGGHILDAGCGSGRDAKRFAALGYLVTAFDASPALAKLAAEHCGFVVSVRTFTEVDEVSAYDGIWCCASLLHVPPAEMKTALSKLWSALRPGGHLYVSYKLGSGERELNGRRFTDADEPTLQAWLSDFQDLSSLECWNSPDQRQLDQVWFNALISRSARPTKKLVTGGVDHFLPHLSRAISHASEIDIAVAFIKTTGLRLLLPDLTAALVGSMERSAGPTRVRVLTSDYLDVTDPEALRLLLLLQEKGAEVRVYTTEASSFHLKAYIFARVSQADVVEGTAFIGSSNISRQALKDGLEWNYRVVYPADAGFLEAREKFGELFENRRAIKLSDSWIEAYERRRVPPLLAVSPGSQEQEPPPHPTVAQIEALTALQATRDAGFRRGLVVMATGLGKTWLAAFDFARVGARRILFVAHREEILSQAAETFIRVRPTARVGFYMGRSRDAEVDVLCASVQTLGRAEHLERFSPQHFDYIVVDEFHHAAASTYRRLLRHFAPAFLLGLTATPDRTDQSDILSLCDDNLVFTRNLFEGISRGLLCPFHYYGIHDESVDYRGIPWRNGRFDPEELSNKLATLARARHAIAEWRSRAQRRTLAFCVSIAHAEYMAAQFNKAEIKAAAVYSGSHLGRIEAVDRLRDGDLSIIFSVDLFNEGVDLPGIDTVMMLRPTDSKILFLQQLGRGLRKSTGKQQLVVLDFIGNHQSFLHKPQALFGVGTTYKALADFGKAVEQGRLELPEGCYVNYSLQIIDFLKSLDSSGPQKDYEALRNTLGRRPSLSEFYRSGSSVQAMRQQLGDWYTFVASMGDLREDESDIVDKYRKFLAEVEVTPMTKSFKMILLEALLELEGLSVAPDISLLAAKSWDVMQRRKPLLSDLPSEILQLEDGTSVQWLRYWIANPVNAWIGTNRASPITPFFQSKEGRFQFSDPVPETQRKTFAALVQELVDYRLAQYEARPSSSGGSNVIPFPTRSTATVELPYFPNLRIACGHFRSGRTDVEEHRLLPLTYGQLDPSRHFVARASGNSMDGGKSPIRDGDYLLLELVSPSNAGSITGTIMAIERQDQATGDNQYLLRVVTKGVQGQHVLRANNPTYEDLPATEDMRTLARLKAVVDPLDLSVGQAFAREEIPTLFGDTFNPGNWNVGHVVLGEMRVHVLLVTLNKQGKAEEHRYHDHWIDEQTFHWQSQNSTTPSSKRGQEIINHDAKRIDIHLFVRGHKLKGATAAPFVYYGKIRYRSHTGSAPMSVIFTVDSGSGVALSRAS